MDLIHLKDEPRKLPQAKRVSVGFTVDDIAAGYHRSATMRPPDSAFSREHCDGTFTVQRDRKERCALSELGIRYWEFVPDIFEWSGSEDHRPCALRATYQLVRNILAACMRDDGVLDMDSGHALVVYDERNPAFAPRRPAVASGSGGPNPPAGS